ncbi:MAG: hypothetical protein JJT76_17080 [Clostridiaceae bacterium]|nr:hypothetical protein [Clostridiaceae bacterium]
MTRVINLKDYKSNKQRQLIIEIYQFLNESLDYRLDNILIDFDEAFIEICNQHKLNPINVNYFRLPIITFIVTSFIGNSDISHHFPQGLMIDNDDNKWLFKNTLIKVLETYDASYERSTNKKIIIEEIHATVEDGFGSLLKIIPQNIHFV